MYYCMWGRQQLKEKREVDKLGFISPKIKTISCFAFNLNLQLWENDRLIIFSHAEIE